MLAANSVYVRQKFCMFTSELVLAKVLLEDDVGVHLVSRFIYEVVYLSCAKEHLNHKDSVQSF